MVACGLAGPEHPEPGGAEVTSKVAAVFEAATPEVLAQRYDDLALSYDDALSTDVSPQRAVAVLARYCTHDDRILDVGCGTGKVGEILQASGYQNLEGLDISSGMLDKARKKDCYVALHQQNLGGALGFSDDTFDAVVGVGVFVRGHAPSSSLEELTRITRPGGRVIFTLRPEFYVASSFRDRMAALTSAGRWRWVETGEPFGAGFKEYSDVCLQVWVYQVMPVS